MEVSEAERLQNMWNQRHRGGKRLFTMDEAKMLRARYKEGGITVAKLARMADCTTETMGRLLRGDTYREVSYASQTR